MSAPQAGASTHRTLGSQTIEIPGVCRIELLPRAPYEAAYTPNRAIIGFAFEAQSGTHAFATSRKAEFHAKPNHLSFVPAGCDVYSRSMRGGEYLKVTLERIFAVEARQERRFSNTVDARAIDATHRLRRQLIAAQPIEALACERLVAALVERVGAIQRGEHQEGRDAHWMTPRRLKLVDEIIDARLDGKLTVFELAARLGLSAGFFTRAFKAAVGKSPHNYIIDRRVARARELLQTQNWELTAIAHATGFASHAHMTTVFRARLGLPPSRLRSGEPVTRRKTI